jgi:lipopolysaccharide export system protein LptA
MIALRLVLMKHTLLAAAIAASTTWPAIDTQAQAPGSNDFFPTESKDFFGFDQNRGKPVEIEGELAEPEANRVERYGGIRSWVLVRLGSTALESHFVTVYYERSPSTAGVSTAELRKAGLAHILKLEASDDVVLTYQDQTAAGDKLVFGIRVNKAWFAGNVVLTQKQNVIKVGRLFADLTTGYVDDATPAPWELPSLNGHHRPTSEKWIYDVWGARKPKDAR